MLDLKRRTLLASSLVLSSLALWLAGVAATASAQLDPNDPRSAEIRTRYAEAERIYEAGDFAGSLAEFDRIYELLDGNPRRFFVLYNIGRCQEQLFRYGDALTSYQRFLAEGGAAQPQAPAARQKIAELTARLATLTIQTNTAAEVWVDGRHVGSAPGEVRVDGGSHTVEVRASGYAPARADVQIAARTQQALTLQLDRASSGINSGFFVAGAALTAIAAGIGIAFGAGALADQSTIQARLASSDEAERFQVTEAQIAAMEEAALFADIFYGAAAVLGVASIVLLFVTDWNDGAAPSPPPTTAFRVTPFASDTAAGLVLEGSL
jgi:hypothetical protein